MCVGDSRSQVAQLCNVYNLLKKLAICGSEKNSLKTFINLESVDVFFYIEFTPLNVDLYFFYSVYVFKSNVLTVK